MDYTQVCEAFSLLAGVTVTEAQKYEQLIRLAMADVSKRLRTGVQLEEVSEIVTMLCAAQAYLSFALVVSSQEGATLIQAGNVSITGAPQRLVDGARAICDELFAKASDILTDTDFVFSGVGNV